LAILAIFGSVFCRLFLRATTAGPTAPCDASNNAAAGDFLKFLQSSKAKDQFTAQGFTVLAPIMSN
jgi:ABC-type molybdate transport system substrate-binding protein